MVSINTVGDVRQTNPRKTKKIRQTLDITNKRHIIKHTTKQVFVMSRVCFVLFQFSLGVVLSSYCLSMVCEWQLEEKKNWKKRGKDYSCKPSTSKTHTHTLRHTHTHTYTHKHTHTHIRTHRSGFSRPIKPFGAV